MSGFTKHMSTKFLQETKNEFSKYLNTIIPVLPQNYNLETVISILVSYYPYEWAALDEDCKYYNIKDRKLVAVGKRIRHLIPEPIVIIESLNITKKIIENNFMRNHEINFIENIYKNNVEKLNNIRTPKINKVKEKIEKAKLKAQEVEPVFLDKLIGFYERKTTTQKDKVYIFKELEKYYCLKVISFFKKKVDTEYNRQLREMAFYHLQELRHSVTLRKQKYMRIPSSNAKRRKYLKEVYANERFNINSIPQELEYRINNSKEQKIKEYDFFISHSSKDFKEVQNIIKFLNSNGKNIYCDWINDTDYLKRHLVGDATKSVIEKRLEQSKSILLIKSEISLKSNWVKYELNYFHSLNKKIFVIDKEDIQKSQYNYSLLSDLWFLDENYKNINLFQLKEEL